MHTETLTTADGVSSELRVFPAPGSIHAVLVFPAMGVPARKYDLLAEAFVKSGVSVAVAELRGLGSSSVRASRASDFGYHELVTIDFPLALEAIRQQFPERKIAVFGHSLGGQLGALCLARQSHQGALGADYLILSAACSIEYRGWSWPASWGILAFSQVGTLIAKILGYYPGKQLGFAGREARTVINDWARTARTGDYMLCNSNFDYEQAMTMLACPLLSINYQDDRFAPQSATERLLSKMSGTKTESVMLSAQDLGTSKADHFSWLRHPDATVNVSIRWLDKQ